MTDARIRSFLASVNINSPLFNGTFSRVKGLSTTDALYRFLHNLKKDEIRWYEIDLPSLQGCVDLVDSIALLYREIMTCDTGAVLSAVATFNRLVSVEILRITRTSVEISFSKNDEINGAWKSIVHALLAIPIDACVERDITAGALDIHQQLQSIVDSFIYLPQLYSACRDKKTPSHKKTFTLFFERPCTLVRRQDLSREMRRLGSITVRFSEPVCSDRFDPRDHLLLCGRDKKRETTCFLVHRNDRVAATGFVCHGFVDDERLAVRLHLLMPSS